MRTDRPSRRVCLRQIPRGAAGLMAACRPREPEPTAASSTMTVTATKRPAPLLKAVPTGAPKLVYTPEHKDLVYTFGGAAAKHRIASGSQIVTWTEDCFDGAVKSAADLPS